MEQIVGDGHAVAIRRSIFVEIGVHFVLTGIRDVPSLAGDPGAARTPATGDQIVEPNCAIRML